MSKYSETAKKLGIRFYVGRYGISFGRKRYPEGMRGSWWPLIQINRLDGWIFDPHEIMEAIANDPDMKISYDKPKNHDR